MSKNSANHPAMEVRFARSVVAFLQSLPRGVRRKVFNQLKDLGVAIPIDVEWKDAENTIFEIRIDAYLFQCEKNLVEQTVTVYKAMLAPKRL